MEAGWRKDSFEIVGGVYLENKKGPPGVLYLKKVTFYLQVFTCEDFRSLG